MIARRPSWLSRFPLVPSARELGPWFLIATLVLLATIVALQDTRYALLVRDKRRELWGWVFAAVCSVVVLRSGIARDAGWKREQLALGTLSNSFYEPRRRWITDGGAVMGGVAGGLWWGVTTWAVLWRGMLRGTTNRGLLSFETSVVVGVLCGGLVGAVLGLMAGNFWERSHRRRRRRAHRHEPLSTPT
jgi:hypothetical protein